MKKNFIELTFEEWKKKYKPTTEYSFDTITTNDIKPLTIWTECNDGEIDFIVNRFAFVNRNGYFITEIPYNENDSIIVTIKNYLDDEPLPETADEFIKLYGEGMTDKEKAKMREEEKNKDCPTNKTA